MRKIACLIMFIIVLIFVACSNKVTQPSDLPPVNLLKPDTSYVIITPAWTEADGIAFNRPADVKIGYDRFVYVADQNNNRVVKLTLAGEFVESYAIDNPTQVTQDRALDLLAVNDSSVVLRRSYKEGGDFHVVYTAPDIILPPPLNTLAPGKLLGIAASPFPDKNYMLANFYENSIFRFDTADEYVSTPIPPGTQIGSVQSPICVNSFNLGGNYYICYTSGSSSFGAQVIDAETSLPFIPDTDSADIYRPTQSGHKDIAMDRLGNIFVLFKTDSEVRKYNRYGVFQLRFGQDGGLGDLLNHPQGIDAYQDYIYIADTENNRIVRFEASTSVQQ
jgi:hypothetical protein